jgi:membrane associated rhomboid family serine protease
MRQAHSMELPLYRLYLLRAMYALIAFAQGSQTWTAILHHTKPWALWHGVSMALLGALTALCLLGIRYPVKMLPLMIFELVWKLIWVLAAWLPLYLGHRVDADTADSFFPIIVGLVLVPIVLPWGYVWKTYAAAAGDRWR